MKQWWLIIVLSACCLLGGCPSPQEGPQTPEAVPYVDRMELLPPRVIRRPESGTIRAVLAELYFGRKDDSVRVTGRVEILAFGGDKPSADGAEPFHVWKIPPEDMPHYLGRRSWVWGYRFVLDWPVDAPQTGSIWLRARYFPAPDRAMYSAPELVSLDRKE